MLKTSPFEVPEPPQRLGARLPRQSEAAVLPSPPREIRPGVFLAPNGKMFTQLEVPKLTGTDAEMLRRDRRGLPSPWQAEAIYAEIFESKALEARRRPKAGDLIIAKVGYMAGREVRVKRVAADLMFSTGGYAGSPSLVWRIANEGVTWRFVS